MKEKITKSLVVALLFLFTFTYFNTLMKAEKKQVRMLRSLLKNKKIKIYNLKALQKLYIQAFLYW